ncbi:MAG: hypothetical protein KJ064_27840 [Anaerolineae bacterium]|nr:hypothetical protein [Anaerolineae bacterium]
MLPPPSPPDDFSEGSHTVTFPRAWLPTLVGILSDTLVNDYWLGTYQETEDAVTWMEEFITLIMVGDE